mmetsp:Transcript_1245/g.2583  ORF Transcript_1245/g.2583 Transcript_1245/m.2583 type:complete len:462 (-) Transcript_1245:54-1439(-)|eukprot:CAMPEP_0197623516 /NCGR_PEP_ID=MMETSP1338-20131121/3507_1 /TAXON_ID=43686 ORGANISM="Pelagodinium beii, Strain RCC1491" /NCGR_SAMPLE_ID=MMETSP1338 /ASSEMBLY_ACC=CAM_ASM_000754 /LENGTH=461 /DNA_ID=CAMNT_0043193509 /DNA_START=91 /DNA_END=1476 /DNA_ORIENTATION=-
MKGERSVADVVQDIGFGRCQVLTSFIVNGSWLADGAELLMISAIATSLGKQWDLSSLGLGSLMSSVYLGTLLGNLCSGYLGDRHGRRSAVMLCYPVIVLGSIASAAAQNYGQLLVLRFLVGLGFGIGQPSAVAILMELSPVKYRCLNQGLAQLAFAAGELYCCFIIWNDDPQMENLHWRFMLLAGAVPALLFWVLSWEFLEESPSYWTASGQPEKAKEALDRMALMNGKADVATQVSAAPASDRFSGKKLLQIASRATAALCFVCFSYNLLVYGAFTAFPQLMPSLVGKQGSPVAELAKGALFEVPCDVLGLLAGMTMPRKTVLAVYFVGVAASSVAFALGQGSLLMAGYYGLKGFPQIGSISLYILASESFPAEIRATGTATVISFGRIGAFAAPVVYAHMLSATGSYKFFFLFCAGLLFTNLLMTVILIPETFRGRPVPEDDERVAFAEQGKTSHGTME